MIPAPYDGEVVQVLDDEMQRLDTLHAETEVPSLRDRYASRIGRLRGIMDRYVAQHSAAQGYDPKED